MKTVSLKEKDLFYGFLSIPFGLCFLLLATVYRTRVGNTEYTLFLYPQTVVFFVFGFFQAITELLLRLKICSEVHILPHIVRFIGTGFVYTAFYNVVLFPLSGLGIIEWIIMGLIILAGFFSKLPQNKVVNIGQSPIAVLAFGSFLFLIKVFVFYATNYDIYREIAQGNKTARLIIGAMCAGALVLLVTQLKVKIFGKPNNDSDNFFKRTGKAITNFFSGLLKIGLSVLQGPMLLAIGLGVVFISIITVEKVLLDFEKMISPLLEKLLSTGENNIPNTTFYATYQTIAMVAILIYIFV